MYLITGNARDPAVDTGTRALGTVPERLPSQGVRKRQDGVGLGQGQVRRSLL